MKLLRSMIMICVFLIYAPVMMAAETGTVAETMESGGYVYIKLEDGKWLAANSFAVSKGDEIQFSGGAEMNDFYSKSLDRKFESILFVSQASLLSDKPAVTVEGHASMDNSLRKPASAIAPAPGEILPLKDGKTVAAIFAESAELKGQVVSLNARVMKVSKQILGKNWITLQDGTGTDPNQKLLATSQEMVAIGALVVAKGTVATEVDLGSGYKYKVLLEEVTFLPGVE